MEEHYKQKPLAELLRDTGKVSWLAIRLAWRASPLLVAGILALAVLEALLAPLTLFLSRAVIDRAALDMGLTTSADSLIERLSLLVWIMLAALIIAGRHLIRPFQGTLQALVGERLNVHIAEQLILAANRWRGLARFEDPAFADDLDIARRRASRGGLYVLLYGAEFALYLTTSIGLLLVLFTLSPLIPAILVVASLPLITSIHAYRQRTGNHLYVQTPESRRLEYGRDMLLTPEPAKDVRLYGLASFFRQRYKELFDRTMGSLDRLRRRLAISVTLANVLSALASGAVYLYVVWLILQGDRSIGDLALYGGAAVLFQLSIPVLGDLVGTVSTWAFVFLPSLYRVIETPPDLAVPSNPTPAPRPIQAGIVFERVHFSYPGNPTPVLRDLSFSIDKGECLALVGRNGAGKTTIVKLLLRLYDPSAGRILLDGIDLREYDPEDLRSEISAVFQDFVRFELTAGENIGLGSIQAMNNSEHVMAAASKAGAAELLEKLPDGPDTWIGREFGGRELSGGEWQKVALARAFMRDSQLLVLDEPTANLDVETEYEIYQRFHQLTRDRTTMLISHRFSTVRMADRIIYLADGRIQEEGSHTDLMTLGGQYAHLYELQSASYLDGEGR